jgi:hypothetical protein
MPSILSPTATKLRDNIDSFEADGELPEWFYEKCVKEFRKVDLCRISVKDIERIVNPFLANWGLMGRVVFDNRRHDWEKQLSELIKDRCEVFKKLRGKDLDDNTVSIDKFESAIKDSYENIANLLGPTSTAKVLHLICPKFFPMWDMGIREGISEEVKKRNRTKFGIGSSAAGYLKFMLETRGFIEKNKQILSQLQQKHRKSLVRLCDEHFWQETHP